MPDFVHLPEVSKPDGFVHLHVHDEHSLLDGAAGTKALVAECRRLGQGALAQTNHGNMFGSWEFYKECTAAGVKPIIGMEAYVAPSHRSLRGKETWGTNDEGRELPSGGSAYTHLTLLAKNTAGVRSLFDLSSRSYAEGFYQKPRIDLELLEEVARGSLFIGSGCLSGELQARLQLNQLGEAEAYIQRMKGAFGDAFFIEVMDHGFDRESCHIPTLLGLARQFDVRAVATNDSHYTSADDHLLHDAMLCMGTRTKLDDPKRMRFDGSGYYLKSRAEMSALALPDEALDNTLWIADQIEDVSEAFAHRSDLMPKWVDKDGWTSELRLRTVVGDALDAMFGSHMLHDGDYDERATHELDVICPAGFADYFLVVADGISWAKSHGIAVGVGRGSAAGSLVAYLLGITGCDPIRHGLLFERFLNPDRVSLPDIDVDFENARRSEVLGYLTAKYGAENCARIYSSTTIGSKSALADSARIMGRPFGTGKRIADGCLPAALFGVEPTLSQANLRAVDDREVFDLAVKLEGLVRGSGMHAGGFVISPVPLTSVLPTYMPSRTSTETSTQWDMHAVEDLGLVKFDLLGLKNLDVMKDALAYVPGLELPDPTCFDDDRTFRLLQAGDTVGCFQLGSHSMRQLLRRVVPRDFGHLVATIALYRPGPMGVGAHHAFADRLNGREDVRYPTDELAEPLRDILGETFGVVVFQEQVMQVLQRVCGYTLAQADLVRKAMGKKDHKLLQAERPRYDRGGLEGGFSKESLDVLWDTLLPFADYAFGKSHSTAYAYNAYWNAWLKANYPWEFMSSLLTHASTASVQGKTSQAEQYVSEVARMQIPVLPPSVNAGASWTPGDKGIHYGVTSIKGVGEKVCGPLLRSAPYNSWRDYLQRAPKAALNVGVVKALIRSGAMDSFGSREGLLQCYEARVAEELLHRADRKNGAVGFGSRRNVVPELAVDWGARRAAELETLGVELSYPPVVVRVPSKGLDITGWEFLRRTLADCRGASYATVTHGSWTLGTPFFVDPEKLPGLVKPLGVLVEFE